MTELISTKPKLKFTGQIAPQTSEDTKSARQPLFSHLEWAQHMLFFGLLSLLIGHSPACDNLVLQLREVIIAVGVALSFAGAWRYIAHWVFH